MEEIETDLKVIHEFQPRARRVFLTGANPFVLTVGRLTDIALLVRKYVGGGATHYRVYLCSYSMLKLTVNLCVQN